MSKFDDRAREFLAQKHIAVAGVSRTKDETANGIYRFLREKGYTVYAVNPHATFIEGDDCYRSINAIPHPIDGAMLVTNPEVSKTIVKDCISAGVPRVWMHNNTLMPSSVSDEAVKECEDQGVSVIAGACPLMYLETGHKCIKWVLNVLGRLPEN